MRLRRTASVLVAFGLLGFAQVTHAQRIDSLPPHDPATQNTSAFPIPQLLVGDLNHDGRPDVVLYGDSANYALGNGSGTYGSWATVAAAPGGGRRAVLADVNADGLLDLVIVSTAGGNLNLSVLDGQIVGGVFSFASPTTTSLALPGGKLAVSTVTILAGTEERLVDAVESGSRTDRGQFSERPALSHSDAVEQ